MSIDALGKSAGSDPAAPQDQRQQLARLAQEFEAMLMTQMLREMRRSMLEDDSQDRGLGMGPLTDTLDIALGQALSRVGGFGLSTTLGTAFERNVGPRPATFRATSGSARVSPPSEGGTFPKARPTSLETPVDELKPSSSPLPDESAAPAPDEGDIKVPQGSITSGFGWRRDPFNGAIKFHKGIDVAQPYGQDVRAAASGQVVASGDQGEYGSTIVVDHGGGHRTRYAHLSALSVQVGDHVEVGQVIGRVGDSGRATGPHLHFEVIDNGRVVNPTGS